MPSSTNQDCGHDSGLGRITVEGTSMIRKRGQAFVTEREADAIAFVKKHTSIPVPDVIDVNR